MTQMTIQEAFLSQMIAAVRVNETDLSRDEVTDLIYAAISDLDRQGVRKIDLEEALTKQAIKLYIKGSYGYDADLRFLEAYENLSAAMALCGDYDEEV